MEGFECQAKRFGYQDEKNTVNGRITEGLAGEKHSREEASAMIQHKIIK